MARLEKEDFLQLKLWKSEKEVLQLKRYKITHQINSLEKKVAEMKNELKNNEKEIRSLESRSYHLIEDIKDRTGIDITNKVIDPETYEVKD